MLIPRRASAVPPIWRIFVQRQRYFASTADSIPRVAQPGLWHSMIPKFMRRAEKKERFLAESKSKEWNPATFYIVIFLLIGSNAINMIALRNEYTTFSRRSDARISVLKDVLERVQKGENVDVEGLLGTGDQEKEDEWEQVLKEIEEDDQQWLSRKKQRTSKSEPETTLPTSKLLKATSMTQEKVKDNKGLEEHAAESKGPRKLFTFY